MKNIANTTERAAQKLMDAKIKVIKIGGGILRDRFDLIKAAKMISEERHRAGPPIVVISAVYGVTDDLIAMDRGRRGEIADYLRKVFGEYRSPSLDRAITYLFSTGSRLIASLSTDEIISLGEKFTSIVFLHALEEMGENAEIVDPFSIITLMNSGREKEIRCNTGPLIDAIMRGNICVVPGFYCSDSEGKTVTLGRGGSDFSAGIIAGSLNADSLEFWKNVPGIMSADPRIVKNAVTLEEISVEMAAELSRLGGKVLHHKTLRGVNSDLTVTMVRNRETGRYTVIKNGKGDGFAVVSAIKKFTVISCIDNMISFQDNGARDEVIAVDIGKERLLITDLSLNDHVTENFQNKNSHTFTSFPMALVSLVYDFRAPADELHSGIIKVLQEASIEPRYSFSLSPGLSVSFAVPIEMCSEAVIRIHDFISNIDGVLNVKN